ncbi:hypothetical protein CEXT_774991 [Caerostris extrusa]|uniref:Uncharacterized protein n=1 Tax=Caerostris extrusa TaxID=172846 RepID=A0AAV4RIY6_CAEEX|nr:hypothetical protein CEXT_774991 [Caerostris extrusa]
MDGMSRVPPRMDGMSRDTLLSSRSPPSGGEKKELEPGTTGGVIGTNQDVDVRQRGNGFCNDVWGTRELRSAIIKTRL